MRPMSGAEIILKAVFFGLERLFVRKLAWGHANVLHMSDLVSLGESCVMHSTRVPENEIARVKVDFEQLTAAIFKPLNIPFAENEEIHVLNLRRRGIFMIR